MPNRYDGKCVCCGFTFNSKLANDIADWIELAYVFTNDGDFYETIEYNDLGFMFNEHNENARPIHIDWPNDDAIAIHRDCAEVIEDYIERELMFEDIVEIAENEKGAPGAPYWGWAPIFLWDEAISDRGEDFFESPLTNEVLRKEIIENLPENYLKNNDLKSVNFNEVTNNEPIYNGLMTNEISEGNVLGYILNNTGKIYPDQGILVRKANNNIGLKSNAWKSVIKSGKNPFTRAPIKTTTLRKVRIKAKTIKGGRRTLKRKTRKHHYY